MTVLYFTYYLCSNQTINQIIEINDVNDANDTYDTYTDVI